MPKVAAEWKARARVAHSLDACRRLRIPTLLVRGTQTVLPAWRVIDRLLQTLPDRELVEIEGAGHMSPLTHATVVAEAIEQHIGSSCVEALFDDAAA
jgi:pimeloyl-ACP methyl ester carboxylesterase